MQLRGKTIYVTGRSSMIGRHTHVALMKHEAACVGTTHAECDLLEREPIARELRRYKPDAVVHLAGYNGNVEFNRRYPADIFGRTARMALNVLEAAVACGVPRVLSLVPSCAYPDLGMEFLREDDLWEGLPNPSVACHGLAKRILDAYGAAIRQQHGTVCTCAIANNSYGEHDSFDLEKTKVVGALIRRFVDAKRENAPEVVCWGSGTVSREFVYAGDIGEGLARILELEDPPSCLNIATGRDITIRELAETIARLVGYEGAIRWDSDKTTGQQRKLLSPIMMQYYLRWEPPTPLETGLRRTIEWYRGRNPYA